MKVLDLFSGIGGFSLGLERAGMETVAFCEFEKHAQKVLQKHWPDVPIHEDVRELDGKQYRGSVDVVCGGFPCQDLSQAGHQAGFDGERSSLYREMLRIISECLPRYAIFENVSGLITGEQGRWFGQFLYDLAEIGFDAEWHCMEAAHLGASHRRDRVWIIAYPKAGNERGGKQKQAKRQEPKPRESFSRDEVLTNPDSNGQGELREGCSAHNEDRDSKEKKSGRELIDDGFNGNAKASFSANANIKRCERKPKIAELLKQQVEFMRGSEEFTGRFDLSEPPLRGANDGVPRRLDRLRRLGNAVVPQIPEAIGRAIMAVEGLDHAG